MDLVTTSFALYIFCCVDLMHIAIWEYVIAVNGNGFADNLFALFIFCFVFFNEYCDLGLRYCS